MKFILRFACLILLLLPGSLTVVQAQDDITAKLKAYTEKHPIEKVYLHFDKPYYAAGDTIYFKGYITLGQRHSPSVLSGVLHVDLVNTANKIDKSIKLQIVNGVTWGDFALPDSLPAGNYRVRAYTQWMRNEGPDAFFEKTIPVGNTHDKQVPEYNTAKNGQAKPDLQFFPEGGILIAGLPSKVAYKAIGVFGTSVGVKGEIVDNTGKTVVSFNSSHRGMGYFSFVPEDGKSYKAEVIYADGSKDEISLPQAEISGIGLRVNNDSIQKATLTIEANKNYYHANKGKAYSILIWSGGYAATVNCKLDSPIISMDIIKRRLFTGIARITLLSADAQALAERLIFVQKFDQLELGLNAEKPAYKPRNKVTLQLKARNKADSAVVGHFSVSVTDESKVSIDENKESTLLTSLLLSSELKGNIEEPNYYFTDITDDKLKNLDLVMLTHGYRYFKWKQVLDSAAFAPKYLAEAGLSVNGTALNLFGNPLPRGIVTLFSVENRRFMTDTADDKGHFNFSNLLFADSARFVLQAVGTKGNRNTKLVYDSGTPQYTGLGPIKTPNAATDTPPIGYLANAEKQQEQFKALEFSKNRVLKEVKISDYRSSSLGGAGHADQVMHAKDIAAFSGQLATSLMGRLIRVQFVDPQSGIGGIPYLTGFGNKFNNPMLVVIDGVVMPSGTGVNVINSNDVETVEVFKYASASIYGSQGKDGVIVITTKEGKGLQSKDIASIGVLPITVKGFYRAREFYAPKYEANLPPNPRPDLRSTIYWNPAVVTDKDGNANFEFFSADAPGTYRVVVEGIDNKGDLSRKVFFIKVE